MRTTTANGADLASGPLLAAMTLATTTDGLQRVLEAALGEHYRGRVRDGVEITVGLWRRPQSP